MGNDAGFRDTLSSGKRGYRKLLQVQAVEERKENFPSEDELEVITCPKKADPERFSLGL
jgi:hypothetical protein